MLPDGIDIPSQIEQLFPGAKSKNGQYTVLCPFHDDRNPSLSINAEKGVFNCFACGAKGGFVDLYSEVNGLDPAESHKELSGMFSVPKIINTVDRHDYQDASGKVIYQKLRIEPGDNGRSKKYSFLNPANGQYKKPCESVLYHLPDVIAAKIVVICEGERKADIIKSWNYPGTCLDAGADSKLTPAMVEVLTGKSLIILPDNDEPGRKYCDNIIAAMREKASSIKVIELPGLPPKGDIVDWVKTPGNDQNRFAEIIEHAVGLPVKRQLVSFVLSLDELVKLDLPEREHIVSPFLPAQSMSLVFARRGLGKSWFCMELALAVAEGRQFLAWNVPTARRVLYIDGEMPTKTLVDRFKALSTQTPNNLDVLPSETLWTEDNPINLNSLVDQTRLETMLRDMVTAGRQPELIIIDNLSSLTAGGDENSNSELDSLLRFLIGLRHQGFAILLVHHAGKSGDQRGASRREDLLDTSIKLNDIKGDDTANGAKFAIEFVKTRGERPDPSELTVELVAGEHGGLEWTLDRTGQLPAQAKLVIAIRDNSPKTQQELADKLGIKQATVSEQLQRARAAGMVIDKKLELTEGGLAIADKYSPF